MSQSSNKEKIVVVREMGFASYVADAFTFVSICFSFWFNYNFIGGNDALDLLLFICFFLFAVGRVSGIKKQITERKEQPDDSNTEGL